MAAMPTAAPISRDVVSFVRRGGRMNPSQQRAWDTHSDWIVTVPRLDRETSIAPDARVDWDALFGRSAPLMVELGSGTGDAVTAAGLARPEANLVAIGVFLPAIGSTLSKLDRAGVGNVRAVLFGRRRVHIESVPGIVGAGIRAPRPLVLDWTDRDLLVMWTDGVATGLDIDRGLLRLKHEPEAVARQLLADYATGTDDAAVVCALLTGASP